MVLYEAAAAESVAVPSCVAPSKIVSKPVGVPFPVCAVTPTLSVSFCPVVSCVEDGSTVVVVAVFADAETLMVIGADVEGAKLASPE